jgi:hypothetical protein
MPNLTIEGEVFDIPDAANIAVGVPMSEGHVASLQQTRRENIRNNFAKHVKAAKANGGITHELHDKLQAYAASYEFGVRQPGSPRVVRDPVEREAMKLIRSAISAAYRAKYNTAIDSDLLAELAAQSFELKGAEYMKRAKKIVAERTAAANNEDIGVAV